MKLLEKTGCRAFQLGLSLGVSVVPFPEPKLLDGKGSLARLPERLRALGVKKPLVVTGKHVSKLPQFEAFLSGLGALGMGYAVFDGVSPDPTVENVGAARKAYADGGCDGIVAFGGGSPMDCAKAAGALIAKPGAKVESLRGYLKVGRRLPPLAAVPTTAGTGSEATVAAVVTSGHDKFAINDPALMPRLAVLDPELTVSLPPEITAATGMDALTHAVEAYIGRCSTGYTDAMAKKAVALVFKSLGRAYADGGDLVARDDMLHASYYAGCAFTRAFVGYVHALAHALGGLYGIPHGLANAVLLAPVLDCYGESAERRLSQLASAAGLEFDGEEAGARLFIAGIRGLNRRMAVPEKFSQLRKEDIPALAAHAAREANPFYPVPKLMDVRDCAALLETLLP